MAHSSELHGSLGHPKLTVGKIYAMCLYVDNYRSYKQGHSNDGVSRNADWRGEKEESVNAFVCEIWKCHR